MTIPVALYVPNLLGYIRIVTAFIGLHLAMTRPVAALWIWIFSAVLDLFDGMLARKLNQTSILGVYLDICADNILRTTMWIAAVLVYPETATISACVVSTEWFTMVSTQLHASGKHWKTARSQDPWLVRNVFAGGFRSPLGVWTIWGLFFAPTFLWASAHSTIHTHIPYFHFFKWSAYSGRALALSVELFLTQSYLRHVIDQDNQKRDEDAKSE